MRTLLPLLVLIFSPAASAAGAPGDDPTIIDIPSTYNGIRCATQEQRGDLYLDVYRGQLGSMYWIAKTTTCGCSRRSSPRRAT